MNGLGKSVDISSKIASASQALTELQFEEEDELLFSNRELPDHACKYCGIHEPSTVVMCNVCKKWSVLQINLILYSSPCLCPVLFHLPMAVVGPTSPRIALESCFSLHCLGGLLDIFPLESHSVLQCNSVFYRKYIYVL